METTTAAETAAKEYRIPDERFAGLKERIEKLGKKALKLVGEPIVLTVVRVDDVEQMKAKFDEHGRFVRDADGKQVMEGTGVFDRFHVCTITGPRPKLAGWELVASLQHLSADGEEVTVVRAVPGQAVPEHYRNSSALVCDHCQTRRTRKDTFVVRHEDGTFKKVGRNCLADFLGHQNPEDVIRLFEYLLDAAADAEESEGGWGGGGLKYFDLKMYLAWVAASIRAAGWLSRTNARNMGRDGQATADMALGAWIDSMRGKEVKPEFKPTEADHQRVEKAVAFMAEFLAANAETNDYLHNLSVVVKLGRIDFKLAGIAGSLLPTAEREMGKEVERRKFANLKATSRYFGTPGEKLFVKATVMGCRELESQYGVTTMVKFATADGNAATWFASGSKGEEWGEVGKEVILAATVKKHEEYQGLKQTVLTRVAAVTQEYVDAEAAKAARKAARAAKKAAKTE